jgi:hypothetical protein
LPWLTAPIRARHSANWGCGAVVGTTRYREARTWYAGASPGRQHFVMLVAASLLIVALLAIAIAVFAIFGVSADGAL